MRGRSVLIEAPATEPVTLAEAKLHLRVEDDESVEDSLIAALISAAREYGEHRTERCFLTQTWEDVFDSFPACYGRLELGRAPVQDVMSIKYIDASGVEQTLDPARYLVDASLAPVEIAPAPGYDWPDTECRRPASVRVRYVAGYGDGADAVPAILRAAIKLRIGELYENRESLVVGSTVHAIDAESSIWERYRFRGHVS